MRTATLVVAVSLTVAQFGRAAVITAEHVTASTEAMGSFVSGGEFVPGQSFTTTVGGPLSTIAVDVYSQNPSSVGPVTISVRDTGVGGAPGNLLGSADLPAQWLSMGDLHEADFSGLGIVLAPNTLYAFTLTTLPQDPAHGFSLLGTGSDQYAGGTYWYSYDSGSTWENISVRDIHFQVSVVPEPATFLIWALGLSGLGWFGWRRRDR